MMLLTAASKAHRLFKQYGPLGLLRLFIWYRVYHSRLDLLLDVDRDSWRDHKCADKLGYRFAVIGDPEHPDFPALLRMHPAGEKEFRRVLSEGNSILCLSDAAAEGSRVVSYCCVAWRNFVAPDYPGVQFIVQPREAYAFSFFVAPNARQSAAARVLIGEGLTWARTQNVNRVLAICAAEQPSLLRFYRAFGFRPTGRGVTQRHLFRFRWARWVEERRTLDEVIRAAPLKRHSIRVW